MAGVRPAKLRVGILGRAPEEVDWASLLGSSELEAIAASDLPTLLRSRPELLVAFARPEDGAALVAALSEVEAPPPMTLLVATPGRPHPQRQLMEILVQARRDWEAGFDALHDPVAIVAADGTVRRANLSLAQALGQPIAEVVLKPCSALLGGPLGGGPDPIAATLADGVARTEEARYTRLRGIRLVTTALVDGTTAGPRSVVAILKDITLLKEQQQRMLQGLRLADVGQLAGGVAHEINTPLASIALRAESLLKKAEDPALLAQPNFQTFPRYLRTINEEIFRCKAIISALLEFSRSRPAETRDTDLNALARTGVRLLAHEAKLKQVELALDLDPELPTLPADEGQLRQALLALLMNALDASQAHGHVTIGTRRGPGRALTLTVDDDGVGIPPENLDKVFSPFFTTKPVGQGTGLGLAVCHGVVTGHGGDIRVESRSPRGTRFTLVLPLDAGRG